MRDGARRAETGCALLLVLMTTGCAAAGPSPDVTRPQPASSSSSSSTATAIAPHDEEAADSATGTAATDALAADAVRSFCHPERRQQEWIAGLDPYLTLAAASVYATVQPSRVACTRVTAAPRPGEGDDFTRLVTVPTDAGPYRVMVTRASASERWLVFRIAPVTAQ